MPNPPKMIKPGAVYFVTSRTEDGLPFIDAAKYKPIFEGIMARAQELYPVDIGPYYFGANQTHLMLGARNPEDFTHFVGYIKQELAHIVNKENGRQKKTIWCEGYDSPIMLGFDEARYYTGYIYSQPVKDGVTRRVRDYKGANGYNDFLAGTEQTTHKRIYRTIFEEASDQEPKPTAEEKHSLKVDHLFWVERLSSQATRENVKGKIISDIKEIEEQIAKEREAKGLSLKSTSPQAAAKYVPKKYGRRMRCICWDIASRARFLDWMRQQVEECKEVYKKWKSGDLSVAWPDWFFPPPQPKRVSPWPNESVFDLAAA